ncbi:MAG: sulfatase [Thermoanaerobaculia bacterium]|nr:sulfatase [Thermoanaerobaculia bacterium]
MRGRLLLGILVLTVLPACRGGAPEAARARSVIVVDIDTLRADHLGTYGYERATSPNLDAFARRGVRFEWAFSQAPYTLPSQTSILTSLYPSRHLVLHDGDRLAPERVTLAERFAAAGFTTGAFVDGGYLKAHFGLDQGFATYFDLNGGGVREGEPRIREWLERHRTERFFLFLHTYDVHTPYAPPEPFHGRFAQLVAPPSPGFAPTSEALEAVRLSQYGPAPVRLPENDLAYAEALYDGEIAYVDEWFGRLMAALAELGLADSTVVAVVSDHGEEFGEHGSLLHEKLYTSVTRVPLLLAGPGLERGASVAAVVETIDLAPTLLELAGVAVPATPDAASPSEAAMEGRSLLAEISGAAPDGAGAGTESTAVLESPFFGVQRSWVDGTHHLIVSLASGRAELYRYREDRDEQHDLAVGAPEELRPLLAKLRRWSRDRPAATLLEREKVQLPPEVEASLRALGYLQ